jgi:hypothetical protein
MENAEATMKKLAVAVVLFVAAILPAAGFTAGQDVPDFAAVQKAAEQGDAKAQYTLGMMYEKGRGVPRDDLKALAWYTKAAEQGDHNAQFIAPLWEG